jgi:hypothetical protein
LVCEFSGTHLVFICTGTSAEVDIFDRFTNSIY